MGKNGHPGVKSQKNFYLNFLSHFSDTTIFSPDSKMIQEKRIFSVR